MFDSAILQAQATRAMNAGPVGPYFGQYVAFLQQHRYTFETIRCSLHAARAFSRWLEREHIALDELSEEVLAKYRDPFRRKYVKPSLPTEVTGLPKLLTWLRQKGLAPWPAHRNETEQEKWLVRFDHHLVRVHGTSDSTRSKYVACAARFIANLFES